jgi:hypothetical protein
MEPNMNFEAFQRIIGGVFRWGKLDRLCDGGRSDENSPLGEMAHCMLDILGLTREEIERVGPWTRASEWVKPGDSPAVTWQRDRFRTVEEYLEEIKTLLEKKQTGV